MTDPTSLVSRTASAIPVNPLRALYPIAAQPGFISLAGGHPSPAAFDREGMQHAVDGIDRDRAAWRYGSTQGDAELRDQISQQSDVHPDEIVVTAGGQQGIDLAVRALTDPGDRVGVPEHIYPATLSALAAHGVSAVPIKEDHDGIRPDALGAAIASGIRALYLTPTFSNPTGSTIPTGRRRTVLCLCSARHVPIIEDDPYRDLWYDRPPAASLWDLARETEALVVSLRSASKIIAPGLRVGWMYAPPFVRGAILAVKQASDLQVSSLTQRIIARYLASGRMPKWLGKVRDLYAAQQTALVNGLAANGFIADAAKGGMFLWLSLPEGVDPSALFDHALENKVLYAPGRSFASGSDFRATRFARLCFTASTRDEIREACARLGKARDAARRQDVREGGWP